MTILITDGRYIVADKLVTIAVQDRMLGKRIKARTTIDNDSNKIRRTPGSKYYTLFAGAGRTDHLGMVYELLERGLLIQHALDALLVNDPGANISGMVFSKKCGMIQFDMDGDKDYTLYEIEPPGLSAVGSGSDRVYTMNELVRNDELLTPLESIVLLQRSYPDEFGRLYISYADSVTGEVRDLVKLSVRQRELMLPKIKEKLLV